MFLDLWSFTLQKICFLFVLAISIVCCAASSFAQLSTNPWVDVNSKEQLDEVYQKYQRRGYPATNVEYVEKSEVVIEKTKAHIEELKEQENPSFIEKIAKNFGNDDKEVEVFEEKASSNNVAMTTSSFDFGAKVNKVKNSFKFPSFNTNNMIRKFEQSVGIDFKSMARKFK